jgi:hypothetical protein
MTPVEGAFYLGVPNLIMVVYGNEPQPPFDVHAVPMRPLQRVVWSIVGDSGSKRNDQRSDLDEVLDLARRFPNVTGAIMDDFFLTNAKPGEPVGRYRPEALRGFRQRLRAGPRPLDLWVVVYAHQLGLPLAPHLDACDVATFWTWWARELPNLETSFTRFEQVAPACRKVLGCYLWDYGAGQPMPVEMMRHQCELGLSWLKSGRIEGMIFLASCISDLDLEAVEWTRDWIRSVADASLASPP